MVPQNYRHLLGRNISNSFVSLCLISIVLTVFFTQIQTSYGQEKEVEELESVLLHPVMWHVYTCTEHGNGLALGDSYGKDCMAMQVEPAHRKGRMFFSLFKDDGLKNEDWYGWEAPVLAPCDGLVESININVVTNEPGVAPDREKLEYASHIIFKCDNGVMVSYAHIRNQSVEVGDRVEAGTMIAEVGNNGVSRAPHLHIGAWRDETPLQIRFDLRLLHD